MLFVALDQFSKYWIAHNMAEGQEWPLLPFLSFYRTRNTGIAFSMLSSFSDIGLIILIFASNYGKNCNRKGRTGSSRHRFCRSSK
ncbi:MAG: hypothetical protein DU430_04620 [Candidatus Tokpelaia sp.]|nr:MAG: hypothetical protein DU430_04620 [Candidatus Tokpelaia sp.]